MNMYSNIRGPVTYVATQGFCPYRIDPCDFSSEAENNPSTFCSPIYPNNKCAYSLWTVGRTF